MIRLKPREKEFIELSCTEMNYKEIADKMCLSYRTMDGYRSRLNQKLGVKTRVGLILFAVKNKLIEL